MLTSQGSEVGILFSGRTMDNLRSLGGMIEAHTGSDGVFTTSMPRVFLIRALVGSYAV
ncbi:hypothetical protein DEU52_14221 [Ensifer adhaerens]|nr:hypothetical protein DEU52_14221 [Ensifer adhaerens]